jgi:creatinine amidohydrolase
MKSWIPDNRNFAYLTWKQVDALSRDETLLVLPTAAIEQHGPHLPLATDTLINSILLGAALAHLPSPRFATARATSTLVFLERSPSLRRPSWP